MNNSTKQTSESDCHLLTPPSSPRKRTFPWYTTDSPTLPPSPRKTKSCLFPSLPQPCPLTPPASPTRSESGNWVAEFSSIAAIVSITQVSDKNYDPIKSKSASSLPIFPSPIEPFTIEFTVPPSTPECSDPVKLGANSEESVVSTIPAGSTSPGLSFRLDGIGSSIGSDIVSPDELGRRGVLPDDSESDGEFHRSFDSGSQGRLTQTTSTLGNRAGSELQTSIPTGSRPSSRQEHKSGLKNKNEVATQESCSTISEPVTPSVETRPIGNAFPYSSTERFAMPLRHSSSPLRPSQWVARGGLSSPPRTPTRASDRFIPMRRPQMSTRESFHLNKPTPAGIANPDPFSSQLRRSRRLNEELRTLRETHSIITGRVSRSRARVGLRSSSTGVNRRISTGAIWNVGGPSAATDTVVGVSNGRGGLFGSGTNAPLYTSMFLSRSDPEAELETHERRLALAFEVDQSHKVLTIGSAGPLGSPASTPPDSRRERSLNTHSPLHVWNDSAWTKEGSTTQPKKSSTKERKPVPVLPFRVLDAPQLRDDYYCSLLAYSHSAKCLAVGLGNLVHLWSERKGVDTPEACNSLTDATDSTQYVTSLGFSSTAGGQAILAVGRADGRIALWSPFDQEPRFDATQPKAVSYVSWRPSVVKRPSIRDPAMSVSTEELLIGDEEGHIYFYSVEWPSENDCALFGWHGAMTLLARITIHTQQICGIAWSHDGEYFATGGNDNVCCLCETRIVLQGHNQTDNSNSRNVSQGPNGESVWTVVPGRGPVLSIAAGREKHKWDLNAAVKAIAFCPWQRGLLAVGGGSNDRCIHFYHTISGACLATIDCAAQVTSLVWSSTRREIAATFGFAQPEHPFRIAVFSWPACEQIVAIPWFDENRALFAIAYPGGPNMGRSKGEDGVWWNRTSEEGCIVVAASDSAIRFHEIWTEEKRVVACGLGLLGGSEILESLHGIEKEGPQTIR